MKHSWWVIGLDFVIACACLIGAIAFLISKMYLPAALAGLAAGLGYRLVVLQIAWNAVWG